MNQRPVVISLQTQIKSEQTRDLANDARCDFVVYLY